MPVHVRCNKEKVHGVLGAVRTTRSGVGRGCLLERVPRQQKNPFGRMEPSSFME